MSSTMSPTMCPPAAVPAQRHGTLPVLDAADISRTIAAVDALSPAWRRRDMPPIDFFTLGAASYLDATADLDAYHQSAAALNPTLQEHFSWLYDRVIDRLSKVFGACALHNPLAYPGFHVFGHRPGAANNGFTRRAMEGLTASVHADRQFEPHGAVWSTFSDVDLTNTMTFTLPLELPTNGAGVCFWGDDSFAAYDNDSAYTQHIKNNFDYRALRNLEAPHVVPYSAGTLFYFMGLARHQIAPTLSLQPHDRRITLQGHGVRCDGVWRLYF
jgi:hypothetical protein